MPILNKAFHESKSCVYSEYQGQYDVIFLLEGEILLQSIVLQIIETYIFIDKLINMWRAGKRSTAHRVKPGTHHKRASFLKSVNEAYLCLSSCFVIFYFVGHKLAGKAVFYISWERSTRRRLKIL